MGHKVSISSPYGKGMVKVWDLKLHMGICGSWKLCGYGNGSPLDPVEYFSFFPMLALSATRGARWLCDLDWSSEGGARFGVSSFRHALD